MRTTSLIGALLLSLVVAGKTDKAHAGVFVSITVAPPPLVVYAQPPLPGPGYIWTPGYWGWDDEAGDYYWVPGAWVLAPEVDVLWTPGYWGWSDGVYRWHDGYWGPHVGFYGGIDYGYGYGGVGFEGGYWRGGVYTYNRNVVNVGLSVNAAVYSKAVAQRWRLADELQRGQWRRQRQAKPSRARVRQRAPHRADAPAARASPARGQEPGPEIRAQPGQASDRGDLEGWRLQQGAYVRGEGSRDRAQAHRAENGRRIRWPQGWRRHWGAARWIDEPRRHLWRQDRRENQRRHQSAALCAGEPCRHVRQARRRKL